MTTRHCILGWLWDIDALFYMACIVQTTWENLAQVMFCLSMNTVAKQQIF